MESVSTFPENDLVILASGDRPLPGEHLAQLGEDILTSRFIQAAKTAQQPGFRQTSKMIQGDLPAYSCKMAEDAEWSAETPGR